MDDLHTIVCIYARTVADKDIVFSHVKGEGGGGGGGGNIYFSYFIKFF